MGAVPYPEPAVGRAVSAHFVPLQVNTADGSGDEIIARYRQVWTPDLRVLDPDGFEYAGWNGLLSEAAYFSAVARYKHNHEADDLPGGWTKLRRRYPASVWRLKQSMVE